MSAKKAEIAYAISALVMKQFSADSLAIQPQPYKPPSPQGEKKLLIASSHITKHPDRDTMLKLRNTAISAAIIMLFIALMLFANR